jgi:hypothetical protein
MEQNSFPAELVLEGSDQPLGRLYLDWAIQPGAYIEFAGQSYTVLERHHRYRFTANRYRLSQIALYVKPAPRPTEVSQLGDRTVIGDATCTYNAHSELVRCAVNPLGPCQGCCHYRVDLPQRQIDSQQ